MKNNLHSFNTKFLSVFLSILMLITTLPLHAFASNINLLNYQTNNQSLDNLNEAIEVEDLREESVKHFRLKDGSYGANSTVGQKAVISYYSGYTEERTSGSDDIYGTSDDIYNRFIFDTTIVTCSESFLKQDLSERKSIQRCVRTRLKSIRWEERQECWQIIISAHLNSFRTTTKSFARNTNI